MSMRAHELHAAVVHAPLMLLPTAATIDLMTALQPRRRRGQRALGGAMWWAGVGSGLAAGVLGSAASQEVRATKTRLKDMMWIHGIGNIALVTASLGMAVWRSRHRPSVGQALLGLGICSASLYTAYLGGEMVYGHGLGVRAMRATDEAGVNGSPRLLSRAAVPTLMRDAARGLLWLFGRGRLAATGRQPIDRTAYGIGHRADAP
jgi:uncharacterized membrane protein